MPPCVCLLYAIWAVAVSDSSGRLLPARVPLRRALPLCAAGGPQMDGAPGAAMQASIAEVAVEAPMVDGGRVEDHIPLPGWLQTLSEAQEAGLGSAALLLATAASLTLANSAGTAAGWLRLWERPLGPAIGGHALSLRAWINEGLMAVFFFIVGLEMKIEMRVGSLASMRKAALPCIAALGGMLVPMAVYFGVVSICFSGGSLAALTVPMATDIAFAMAVYGAIQPRSSRDPAEFCRKMTRLSGASASTLTHI